jgi:hypothetical protein
VRWQSPDLSERRQRFGSLIFPSRGKYYSSAIQSAVKAGALQISGSVTQAVNSRHDRRTLPAEEEQAMDYS